MKLVVTFEKGMTMWNHTVRSSVSSDLPEVVNIETNESGVQVETEDKFFFVPWHNVRQAAIYK